MSKNNNNNSNKLVKLKAENSAGKKVGADAKACWEGYRYQGTKNGRDVCVKTKK